MSEENVVAIAQKAVGDTDTIIAAAWFRPRGTSGGTLVGMDAGNMASDMAGGGLTGAVLQFAGTFIGFKKGRNSGGLVSRTDDGMVIHQVPYFSLIAVSEKNIYAWHVGHNATQRTAGEVLFALPRAEIEVKVHVRATVRTFEVLHASASEKWEFEGNYVGSHVKPLLDALNAEETTEP
ncbi:MAG: hypothetical protein WEA11_07820 [Acidimicrobiales bacterium]